MKKLLQTVVIVVFVVVAIALIVLTLFGGPVIKKAVNSLGPMFLRVPVSVQDVRFSPLQGRLGVSGLYVGNPKGFKTEALLEVGRIEVEMNVMSLFADTIVVHRILVHEPQITYEQGLRNSNLGALLEQLGGRKKTAGAPSGTKGEAPVKPSTGAKSGRKIVIDELTLTGGKVKLSITGAMGLSAPIALATISMKNIGRENGTEGVGLTDVVRIILGTVMKSVVEAVGGVGGLTVDGLRAIGGGAKKVGEGTVDTLKSLGGEKAVEGAKAMGQGAVQVGGAAVEGVKQLGSGVGKAIGGLVEGDATNAPAPNRP